MNDDGRLVGALVRRNEVILHRVPEGLGVQLNRRDFRVGSRALQTRDRLEFGLSVITLLTVALIGVEQGIVVAVAFSIPESARRGGQPALRNRSGAGWVG